MTFFPEDIPIEKRGFDLLVSAISLVILSPFLLITALAVLVVFGLPILFSQKRPGYREKPFTIFKFRTMADEFDSQGDLLPDEKRLNWLGRVLRASSIDELPELFNVFNGDMSLVGPRPLLMQYLERYNPEQARRHEVLPGITGWAQINGRNAITWEDKFRYDVWYIDNWSFWLDMKIIGMTIWKAFQREGINQPGYISASEFMGSENNSQSSNDLSDNQST
jgi:lipopolysaccharide/colanic/teichoic acid biosynthesis glycosyltransferase